MSQLPVGTPDNQRGIITPGKLLATVAAGTATVTVAIPPNGVNLLIATEGSSPPAVFSIVGVTTGFKYPTSFMPGDTGYTYDTFIVCSIFSQLDLEVVITFGVAPVTPWYVVASASVEKVIIANMPNPASTVVGPDAYGDPAVVGTKLTYAREDHDHGLPAAPTSSSAVTLIASQVLAGAVASVTFSAIPQTYHHLRLVCVVRSDRAATVIDQIGAQLNGDTGAHYDVVEVYGSNGSVQGNITVAASYFLAQQFSMPGASGTAGLVSSVVIEIPLYSGATFQKVIHSKGDYIDGAIGSSDSTNSSQTATWRNGAAVSSITLFSTNGANFVTGCAFYLYGVT